MAVSRFEVYLVRLDPTVGSEIQKTRPCVVVSPDEMNRHLRTVIVAPMTTKGRAYPTRITCRFRGKPGQVVLDQLRTVDTGRFVRRLGLLDKPAQVALLRTLGEMFAP
jgi:mRNA interferase MazF